MNENIQFAISNLQAANAAFSTAQFNLAEAAKVHDAAMEAENNTRTVVRQREQELMKAVQESQA